jgi:2'-5' RNA ligase
LTRFEGDAALVVHVAEAEPAVGEWRLMLDPAADHGVGAHITVLFPFVAAVDLDEEVLQRIAAVAADHHPFDFSLVEVRWFERDVVYLAPEPETPFRALTESVWAEFPEHPPYEGAHGDPVPHLTVGQGGPLDDMRRAADAVDERLPIRSRATALDLIVLEAAVWAQRARFPLGG